MAVSQPAGAWRARGDRSAADLGKLAWIPVVVLFVGVIAGFVNNPGAAFDRAWLLLPLSAIFMFGLPLLIAVVAIRSYRETGVVTVLALGAGMLGYSIAGGVLPSVFLQVRNVNAQVSIHNWAVLLLSACCFFTSPLMPLGAAVRSPGVPRGRRAALTYGLVLSAVLALSGLTLSGIIPAFREPATGFTPLREAVLGLSLGMLLITGAAWWQTWQRTQLTFTRWYALGLTLYAIGILGILIELEPGDLVSWIGRAAQFMAAPYFLMAVLSAGRERGFAVELVQSAIPYRPLVESISEPLVALDRGGGVMYWNRAAQALFGYSAHEVFGRDLFELISPPSNLSEARSQVAAAESATRKGAPAALLELSLTDRSGRTFPAELAFYAAAGFPEALRVWVVRDVTERKAAEAELGRHRAHLEEMVQARTAELATANKELEGFSYSMSHVLSAPLRAIDGYSHLLIDDYAAKLDQEGRRRIDLIRANVREMSLVIDDVLEFLRLGRQPLAREAVDMAALVAGVLAEYDDDVRKRGVAIRQAALPVVEADAEMMAQVWRCLIDNALKFSAGRPEPQIEIGAVPGEAEVVFFVRDNGVGFDMRYADRLFGVFYRAHGTEFEGNGMGLAVVQRIIVKHGGRVWAEGAPGRGATLFFALPKTPRP